MLPLSSVTVRLPVRSGRPSRPFVNEVLGTSFEWSPAEEAGGGKV
jgi:hypothetical protein